MGINKRFTVAVIAIAVVGFTGSFYVFSTQLISNDWIEGIKFSTFDKSKYIQKIDACLESQRLGNINLNSFAVSFVTNLKQEAEAAESEEKIKEILNRVYTITSCEP